MSDRKYSVYELDALRRCMENKYLYGSYAPISSGCTMSRSYQEAEKTVAVEQMVRTAMLAGHTAEDYEASCRLTIALPESKKTL